MSFSFNFRVYCPFKIVPYFLRMFASGGSTSSQSHTVGRENVPSWISIDSQPIVYDIVF